MSTVKRAGPPSGTSMRSPSISRRQALATALGVGALRAGTPKKLKIIVTGGHPGAPEYGCGGTIARYTDLGHDVTLLYLNRGEKGCPDTPQDAGSRVRVPEAKRACEILKARPVFASQCDGNAVVDRAH